MKHVSTLFLSVLALAVGCRASDNCDPNTTQCADNVAEVCDADRNWQPQLDCDDVGRKSSAAFKCEFVSEDTDDGLVEGHTCVPANVGGGTGGAS
jgi:hypothetical protein